MVNDQKIILWIVHMSLSRKDDKEIGGNVLVYKEAGFSQKH